MNSSIIFWNFLVRCVPVPGIFIMFSTWRIAQLMLVVIKPLLFFGESMFVIATWTSMQLTLLFFGLAVALVPTGLSLYLMMMVLMSSSSGISLLCTHCRMKCLTSRSLSRPINEASDPLSAPLTLRHRRLYMATCFSPLILSVYMSSVLS